MDCAFSFCAGFDSVEPSKNDYKADQCSSNTFEPATPKAKKSSGADVY